MTSPFFLTRQTANLMEGFTRELKTGAALFLLYGESGVGKTRLLQELRQSRLAGSRIHWLDLSEGSGSDDNLKDNSRKVAAVFANAQQGDIIIADHFEMALKKTRHQLLVSCSTEGIDKQLNTIIASSTEGFNELRQLSQQHQVRVQSFQQMPFSSDEVEAFVGFYLFPDHPTDNLSIPPTLRKQFADARGVVGRIIDIIERDAAQVKLAPMTNSTSIRQRRRIIATVLFLILFTAGIGWYYLGNQAAMVEFVPELATTESESMTIVEPVPGAEMIAPPEVEPVSEVVANLEAEAIDEQLAESELDAEPETRLEAVTEAEPEADTATEAATQDVVAVEPGTASDTAEVIVEAESYAQQETTPSSVTTTSSDQTQIEPTNLTRFQRELKMSYDWITSKSESVGTMQILMLSFKTFDEAVFYQYVESLASKQVDITQLKVFKTSTGGTEFYSVFYGEYASLQVAKKAKGGLPEVIRKTSPIVRSVGGILQEIRRLEVKS